MSLKKIKQFLIKNKCKLNGIEGVGLDYKAIYFIDTLQRGRTCGGNNYTQVYKRLLKRQLNFGGL